MADDFVSDEDKDLFRDHMRSVKPLHEKTKRAPSPSVPKVRHPEREGSPSRSRIVDGATARRSCPHKERAQDDVPGKLQKDYFLSDYIQETVLSNTLLSYCHPSVPSKRFRALKNGQIPWETRLDLHGLTTEAARDALSVFIENQTKNNNRCLLIIHGKGGHEGAPPVVKNLINRWLPQFPEILAFHSALSKDGGYGAVYVLLKRNR